MARTSPFTILIAITIGISYGLAIVGGHHPMWMYAGGVIVLGASAWGTRRVLPIALGAGRSDRRCPRGIRRRGDG